MNDSVSDTSTALSGEVLDSMQPQTALAVHANPYLGMIEAMVSRGGDLSNLDKMLDLQIKWEANEARKAYVAAMAAFKAEPMEILKRKLVSFTTRDGDTTSYSHAELADVTDAVVPAMGKHGLSHRWDVQQAGGQITVTCTITHALGHSESVSMTAAPDASGKKNAIQQVASATTYLQRYTLLAATGMATKGMDDDGRSSQDEGADEAEIDQSWLDGIEACVDRHGLKALKAEMVTTFGNATAIPKELIRAYNAKWATVA
jgi:hypothetical protein